MTLRGEATLRNAGLLVALRGLALAGGVLYAMLVPRAMGPETYGQLALIVSLSVWFELASGLGITQVVTRETGEYLREGEQGKLQDFFGSLLTLRSVSGLVATAAFYLLTRLWLVEIEMLALAAVAATVVVQSVGSTLFSFFLGLNQAARWAANDVLSRWLPLAFLLPGYRLGGLTGACLGLLAGELLVVGIALVWARPYLSMQGLWAGWSGLAPFRRFALGFYGVVLITALFHRGGGPMVRLFHGDYAQVGFFGLAYAAYLAVEALIPQLTLSFAPFLTSLQRSGELARVARWSERLLRMLGIAGMAAVAGGFLVGRDVLPLALGAQYSDVAIYLLPLTLALLPHAVGSVSRMLAVVFDQPGVAIRASLLRLIVLWVIGPPLVARWGGLGACVAILLAVVTYGIYFAWRMRGVAPYPLMRWGLALLLGAWFLPLMSLRSSLWINLAIYAVYLAGYVGLLLATRLISPQELRSGLQVIRTRRSESGVVGQGAL